VHDSRRRRRCALRALDAEHAHRADARAGEVDLSPEAAVEEILALLPLEREAAEREAAQREAAEREAADGGPFLN
jgi:hypothetical protein